MNNRMAGTALASLLGGGAAAIGADAAVHDEMDRTAQAYKDWAGNLKGSPEVVQQAYVAIFGRGEMSAMDRQLATGILNGSIPPSAGPVKGDNKAGTEAIELAQVVRVQAPELGGAVGQLAQQELGLFAREAQMGVSSGDVMQAAEQGAGVSPVPALLAGLAGGGTGAGLAALLGGRGGQGDAFAVPRRKR